MLSPLIIGRSAIVAAFAVLFGGVAFFATSFSADRQNRDHLDEINDTAIRYVELAIRSAGDLLAELNNEAPTTCDEANLQRVRVRVYQHSVIKDIRVATHEGAVRCSAYPETLEFDRSWPSRDEMLTDAGRDLRVFRVEQFSSDALGVFRDVSSSNALVAIVSIDPLQFDIMPFALRGRARVALELANGEVVVANAPGGWTPGPDAVSIQENARGYPVRMIIQVDPAALAAWGQPPLLPLLGGGGALGALFGYFVARAVGRPASAADALDKAIRAREFQPFYQPIFSLTSRRIIGCEILMRWIKPDGRTLPPSAFIPLAESTGRIETMTWDVLGIALAELRATLSADPAFKMSVNIVPRHFLSDAFLPALRQAVRDGGVSPKQIVLELTERDDLEDLTRARAIIAALRETGFRIALDDVGVGHSGLSHIQSLRPDILKIDKFFVDSLELDAAADSVVGMLVRLALDLGMGLVAEGVETETQVSALRRCGVHEGQGYLVAPPLPLPKFLDLISASNEQAAQAA